MWKKAVQLGALGYVLGIAIGVAFFLADPSAGLGKALPYILVSGIPGCVSMGSSVIYSVEKWSIARATVTHFLITFACFYLISFALNWFRFGDSLFWVITAAMMIGYFIVWLMMYLAYKRRIRKINEGLRKLKSSRNTD